ncbi:MAG: hypothetical protein BWZ02_00359 [Lentisphaerae bacterium ADurb.BinA184]|nr:MAG: hypothetical protein BWZ02_00359 [Lentisphaerae bacterium ADurb.BinA184]
MNSRSAVRFSHTVGDCGRGDTPQPLNEPPRTTASPYSPAANVPSTAGTAFDNGSVMTCFSTVGTKARAPADTHSATPMHSATVKVPCRLVIRILSR